MSTDALGMARHHGSTMSTAAFRNEQVAWRPVGHGILATLLVGSPGVLPLIQFIAGRGPPFLYRAPWNVSVHACFVAAGGQPRNRDPGLFSHGYGP